ncbi:unnamed protein product, partial [Ceutorhynchus assimilis]
KNKISFKTIILFNLLLFSGPRWIPLIGHGPELRKLAKYYGGQHLAFEELSRRYDTNVVGLKLGQERIVCACSYQSVKQVMTSDEFLGRPDNFFFRLRTMGARLGITGTDGDLWKNQRAFLTSHLRALGFGKDYMEKMVKAEVEHFISLFENREEGLDLAAALPISVLNILWNLICGQGLEDNYQVGQFLELLKKRTTAFDAAGGTLNNYPWLRFIIPEKSGYNLLGIINFEITDFISQAVNEHKANWTEDRTDDFIYAFLREIKRLDKKESYFTDDQLIMVCLDIFIAGSTTTSDTISFAFLAMILFPEVQKKVHDCIDHEFRQNEDVYYADRQRAPYIEAVLLECQRMFPVMPVAGIRRTLRQAYLDQYIIPKNTTVLVNLHSVHHDQDYWKDPENFRPERFLDENGSIIRQDRVLTFGLGKRKCLGDVLAKSCIFLFFVEILRKYKIEHHASWKKPTGKQTPGISMTPEKYRAKFIPRF